MMRSLADTIIEGNQASIKQALRYHDINGLDEYGFRPLIEAAITDRIDTTQLLLEAGADPNTQDATGGTALQWAIENNNTKLCQLLLEHGANPNSYNFAGQPVLAMPILRQQEDIKTLLLKAGADLIFAQDYINVKLMGHMYELTGTCGIISPSNQFVEVDFEGFYLEVTLGIISESLYQFQHHFAARQLRRYEGITKLIVDMMLRAAKLTKYQQYRTQLNKNQKQINQLLQHQPLLIPVGYEGHAITFIQYQDMWIKCDRREDSRLYDNIVFYRIQHQYAVTKAFLQSIMFERQDSQFVNQTIDEVLGLAPLTTLKVDAQVSGNCSWANVEACIPAIFYLVLHQNSEDQQSHHYYKTLALNYFNRWREWNKDRALDYCIQAFKHSKYVRQACKAEILAAVLFQCSDLHYAGDKARVESILNVLLGSRYEYLIKNYLKVYLYETNSEKGRGFIKLLKSMGYKD